MLTRFLLFSSFCITNGCMDKLKDMQLSEGRSLRNKLAVVTGAAQGIGYAITDHFLEEGVKAVIILDKQFEKGMESAIKLNNKHGVNRAVFIYCDVTKDLEEVSNRILNEYKYIDIFVNNAGVLDECSPEDTIETNSLAVIRWCLKFWQHMRKDKHGKGGTIINLSSAFGYYIHPFLSIYTASKYAVLAFSKSLGHEYTYRKTGVRVIALCPGFTDTALVRQPRIAPEQIEDFNRIRNASQWQKPDDVAKGAVQLFETAESCTAWNISGGNDPVEAPASVYTSVAYIDSLP